MTFFNSFKRSAAELKDIRCLVVTAVLIALDLVLKLLKIYIPPDIKVSCAFIAVSSIGMLYGPTVAGLACVATDIIGYMIAPDGGFSPLFTLVEVTGGVIYGCFLYNFTPIAPNYANWRTFGKSIWEQKLSFLRIAGAKVTVAVVCNLVMTPAFLQLSKGQFIWQGFIVSVGKRLIKNAISVPIEIFILIVVLSPILSAYNSVFGRKRIVNN